MDNLNSIPAYFKKYPKEPNEIVKDYIKRILELSGNVYSYKYARKQYFEIQRNKNTPFNTSTKQTTNSTTTINGDKMTYEGTFNFPIKTEQEAMTYSKVDLQRWEVESIIIKHWSTTTKDATGQARITQNSGVTLKLKKRVAPTTEFLKEEMITYLSTFAPTFLPITYKTKQSEHCLEIDIFDLHLGKLAWSGEVGESYDLQIAEKRFYNAIDALISKTQPYRLGQIWLPFGNDFFNADNMFNTTTAGTPQDQDGRWQKIYVKGREMLQNAILKLVQIAPVEAILVQGNHDTQSSFYLADALKCIFANNEHIQVDSRPHDRKYKQFGKNMLGLTHGNNVKDVKLPLIMAQEAPQIWAETTYREWHLGHWHTNKEISTTSGVNAFGEEFNGVTVRKLRSLSATDAWHKQKGYSSLQSATAFLYHKENGIEAILNHNV